MILLIAAFILLPFALVLFYGAPYLPTRKRQANLALDMLNLKKGEVFVDLGCGDGIVLIEAAKRGLDCYGYELNPLVWLIARLRTLRYGNVHVYCRNFWNTTLPKQTAGVFVFLLDKYMIRLNQKLAHELPKGSALLSYTFQIPNKKPTTVHQALYLYHY